MAFATPEQDTIEQDNPAVYLFWLKFWRMLIASIQVMGGAAGIYFAVTDASGSSFLVTAAAFSLFLLALVAGVLLVANKNAGIILSLIVQALQLFQISTAGVIYSFVCGPKLVVGYYTGEDGNNLGFSWGLLASLRASWNTPSTLVSDAGAVVVALPAVAVTGLNVVALGALICLLLIWSVNRSRRGARLVKPAT